MTKDEALERKAENARELGLDYEPQLEYVAFMDVPHRPWVGLTDEEAFQICVDCGCLSEDWLTLLDAIEAKLKEKNT